MGHKARGEANLDYSLRAGHFPYCYKDFTKVQAKSRVFRPSQDDGLEVGGQRLKVTGWRLEAKG